MDKTDKSSRRSRDERSKDRSYSSKDHRRDTASDRGRHHYEDSARDSGSARHRDDGHDESVRDSSSRRYRDDVHDESVRDSTRSRRHQDDENDESVRDSASRRHRDDENGESVRDSASRRHRDGDRHRHHHRDRERSRSEDRDRVRDSVERGGRGSREESVEKASSRKRKIHGGDREENVSDKRVKVSEEKRERRRFEDRVMMDEDIRGVNGRRERKHNGRDDDDKMENRKVKEEEMSDGEDERRVGRRFRDGVKDETDDGYKEKVKEENFQYEEDLKEGKSIGTESRKHPSSGHSNGDHTSGSIEKSNSGAKAVSLEKHDKPFELVTNVLTSSNYSVPSKVSFTTTNENEGVNIIRSDGVPGKSSTDGASISVPGKSDSLSLDALAKAKRALQMQKELTEKLKKIPALGKLSSPTTDTNPQVEKTKAAHKPPSSVQAKFGTQSLPGPSDAASSSAKPPTSGDMAPLSGLTVEAVKRAQEVAARMGFHQDPQFAPLINMFPVPAPDVSIIQKPSKAPVLRLDAQGREIDEHGNVVNVHKHQNLSTLKVNINKQKKEAFQILRPELDAGIESNPHFDEGLGVNKTKLLRPKRMSFQFVEEGKWSRQAEITRFKNQFGEAQAKELRTKQAQLAKAKAEPDINPNLIEISERVVIKEKQKDPIPDVEWWDLPLLPTKSYPDETSKDNLNMEKITIYIEHPLPIQPPAESAPPPPQPLKLTKRENKKLRTQRRLAKEKDRQEMIRQGLIEPPKSKVKMSNLMRVLGSEATQDPTRLEMEIRSAAAEREQAHADRNIARKLTPAERREKKEKKLFEDSTLESTVTIYRVNRLSHPKARFQVDVNAQENRLAGCAVICDDISIIVVEGGKKSNKRYRNLMLKRIDWSATAENEEEEAEDADTPLNKCSMVWQGCVAKHSFNRFHVHQCRTEAAARKIFSDAGVPHYWDLAVNYSDQL